MSSMKFADVLQIINGKNQKLVECENGQYPIYGSGGIMGWANDYICPAETVIIGRKGSINNPIFVDMPFWNVDTAFGLVADKNKLLPKYLYYFCCNFIWLFCMGRDSGKELSLCRIPKRLGKYYL